MAKIEVKQVRATMTIDDRKPHWEAVVDYGAFEVALPLPGRRLETDDEEIIGANILSPGKSLAEAFLRFAVQTRRQWLRD